MRRRVVARPGAAPAYLRRYDPADWPNPACHPECAFWAAVEAHMASSPESEDAPLDLVDGPDVPWHPEWVQTLQPRT